jgi:peptide/nickel transport system permease protein
MMARRLRVLGWRLLQTLPVALLATFIVFGLLQLVPGDPAVTLAGESATVERIAQIRAQYGLDRPLLVQYGAWVGHALQGDLSRSLLSGVEVRAAIARRLPDTLLIVLLALGFAFAAGIPLGIAAAVRTGSVADAAVSGLAALGVALPNFWLAMILISIFAVNLGWLPATGSANFAAQPIDALRHALLPAIALGASGVAEVARQLRGGLGEYLNAPAVRTLRAKGLSGAAILWRHGVRNVGVTLLTVAGLLFNRMLGATVVIEAVFAVPGIGTLVVEAARNKDFPIVQGVVLMLVGMVILTNMLVDFLYVLVDPRVERP